MNDASSAMVQPSNMNTSTSSWLAPACANAASARTGSAIIVAPHEIWEEFDSGNDKVCRGTESIRKSGEHYDNSEITATSRHTALRLQASPVFLQKNKAKPSQRVPGAKSLRFQ